MRIDAKYSKIKIKKIKLLKVDKIVSITSLNPFASKYLGQGFIKSINLSTFEF